MAQPPERPRLGGSYLRKPDGTLERVAFTAPPPPKRKPAVKGAGAGAVKATSKEGQAAAKED